MRLGGQAAAVAQATGTSAGLPGLVSGLPAATQSLSGPVSCGSRPASALSDFFSNSLVAKHPERDFRHGAWNGFNGIVTGILYGHTADAGLISHGLAPAFGGLGIAGLARWLLGDVLRASVRAQPDVGGNGRGVLGRQAIRCRQRWSAATPAEPAAAAPLAGSGWTAPAEEGGGMSTVAAGMPAYASAGRGGYGMGPRYGVKPTVMPTKVLVCVISWRAGPR